MEKAQIGPVLWLVAFVGSGIGLGQTFELLLQKPCCERRDAQL